MNNSIQEAWNKFFGTGWTAIELPARQECFEAGWKACLEHMKSKVKLPGAALSSNMPRVNIGGVDFIVDGTMGPSDPPVLISGDFGKYL